MGLELSEFDWVLWLELIEGQNKITPYSHIPDCQSPHKLLHARNRRDLEWAFSQHGVACFSV